MRFTPLAGLLFGLFGLMPGNNGTLAHAQNIPDYEQPPILYSNSAPHDAVRLLQQRLASGQSKLLGSERALLSEVLRELNVPVESQILVFSKTSLQRGLIRPDRPRALYFSDSVYVGWVPGGLMEVVAIDPRLGPIFYALDPRGEPTAARTFARDADCLRCHGGSFVRDIPGVLARSVFPNESGEPIFRMGSELVDDQTPFDHRWGGWYVTGYQGGVHHRGNVLCADAAAQPEFIPSRARPEELSAFFDTSRYLRATSDVVALLVFEHQMAMQNTFTQAGQSCRKMLDYQRALQKAMGEPETDEPQYDSVKSVFAGAVEKVVDHLLFQGAAVLPEGIIGTVEFRARFQAGAPRSKSGHSLKDFQVGNRLFANRCSYLIYSEAFAALPPQLRARIFDSLLVALTHTGPADRYAYLETEEKKRIYAILLETLPEAKARWGGREKFNDATTRSQQ